MTGPTRRDELISSFSSKLFSAMLHEVIMDATLQSHRDVVRSRTLCTICGTRCGSVHGHGGNINGTVPSTSASTSCLPAPNTPPTTNSTASGSNTIVSKEKNDGNIYFECTNCQKKIASNRYAPHLSGCLGIGTGSRRGAARNAAVKNKLGAETDRGASPLLGSDYGSPAHENVNGKGKGKGKGKKINGKAIDAEINGNSKRPHTPDSSQAKKVKKQKTSAIGFETTTLVGDSVPTKPQIPPTTKIPIKSAVNPASPYVPGSPSGSGSPSSGHDSPSASASRSVSSFAQSPTANLGSRPLKSYGMSSENPQKKRPRPPSSSRSQVVAVEVAIVKRKTEKEDPDFIDVDEEEQEDSSSDSS